MLRGSLLYLSRQGWLRHWVETSSLSAKVTGRFVAGVTLDQEVAVIRRLNAERILATLDCLGENVTSPEAARASLKAYLDAIDRIEKEKLNATVSVKLTQFGLDLSDEGCMANIDTLVQRAKAVGGRVEIDMESSEYVDRTLDIVRTMHERHQSVRAVIQAYLYRSEKDIEELSRRGIPVRLCKGAYKEAPTVAYPHKPDVDANYVKLMLRLLDSGTYPAIASHDEVIIDRALSHVQRQKISPERFEFQMLYGIRRDLQRKLADGGYRVRSYVPYGDAWYPYFMRRLAERPANLIFLARNLVR